MRELPAALEEVEGTKAAHAAEAAQLAHQARRRAVGLLLKGIALTKAQSHPELEGPGLGMTRAG